VESAVFRNTGLWLCPSHTSTALIYLSFITRLNIRLAMPMPVPTQATDVVDIVATGEPVVDVT